MNRQKEKITVNCNAVNNCSIPEYPAEFLEGRIVAKGNSVKTAVTQTQSWGQALTGLGRVREAARTDKSLQFTNLMHHITPKLLQEAFFSLRRNAAAGIDNVMWKQYRDSNLLESLKYLHDKIQSGSYKALANRRVWIPKTVRRQRRTVHDAVVAVASPVIRVPIEGVGSNAPIRDDGVCTRHPAAHHSDRKAR